MANYRSQPAVGATPTIPPEERYRIIGRIASGGMAEIYLARMSTPGGPEREVVLKRLMPELQTDQEFVQMFYDEANIAAKLKHPNIVQIFELGELDGSLFISMELLRGLNLRDLLARLHIQRKSMPVPVGVRIACAALEALDYAHSFADASGKKLNVVHRDVSPQNIIVTYDGTVKLVDFGVAKAEGRLHQTRAGLIKGKFAYMSPEQVSGGRVDGRSDLFALSEVFYELLLKRHPFYAESDMEVLRAILDKDPPHPSALDGNFPSPLGEILMKGMKKAPGDRFPTAGRMQDALERFLEENRTPVTTGMLGRFMSELFADRLERERQARVDGDEEGLLEAMTAGRAEEVVAAEQQVRKDRKGGAARVVEPEPEPPQSYGHVPTGERDRVVEISRSHDSDPAEGAPVFIAHSGYTNPGVNKRRFQDQVQALFEDPQDTKAPEPMLRHPNVEPESHVDEGEMPTMLGQLSVDQLREIREHRSQAKRPAYSPGVTVGPAVSPSSERSNRTGDVRITPAKAPRGSAPPTQTGPISNGPSGPSVTPRSRTVFQNEAPTPGPKDRIGLVFFVAGLGALLGALGYAAWLYTHSQTQLAELEVLSEPVGAKIILDGVDTGVKTPHVFPSIAGERAHTFELRLEGFQTCLRSIVPSGLKREQVNCALVKSE
ncbi:MAG: serine/threonine protein kinase [Deltaproteobacteria bacterium]|nr:serine/threonine protein kinase [Deltaproteobacteria bacterium]